MKRVGAALHVGKHWILIVRRSPSGLLFSDLLILLNLPA